MAEDVTNPNYLTRPELGIRRVRVLSGRGLESPGYRLVGEGKSAPSESLQDVAIVKMVDPLSGKGPADLYRRGRDYGRSGDTLDVKRLRVQKSVAANQFGTGRVVRPPRTAIRRMNNKGQGTVSYV